MKRDVYHTAGNRCWGLGLLVLVLVLPLRASADAQDPQAQVVPSQKKIGWHLYGKLADLTGGYSLERSGYAKCDGANDTISGSANGTWSLGDGVYATIHDGKGTATAHTATASAYPLVEANIAQPDNANQDPAEPGWYFISGWAKAPTSAEAPKHLDHKAEAEGRAEARAWVQGRVLGTTVMRGTVTTAVDSVGNGKGKTSGAGWIGPISLTLVEDGTDLTYSEQLLSLEASGSSADDGGFSWSWGDLGVTLSTPRNSQGLIDGTVSVGGVADSAWLVDPIGAFQASLSNGSFQASGAWAGLPWVLTYDGSEVVEAFLSSSAFSTEMLLDYEVPDALIDDATYYDVTLSWDSASHAEATIPEPATMGLVVLGAAVVLTSRKRARSR